MFLCDSCWLILFNIPAGRRKRTKQFLPNSKHDVRYAFSCSQKVTSAERALISSLLDKLGGLGGAMRKTAVQKKKKNVLLSTLHWQFSAIGRGITVYHFTTKTSSMPKYMDTLKFITIHTGHQNTVVPCLHNRNTSFAMLVQ